MKITLYYGVRLYNNRIINESLEGAMSCTFSEINFNAGDGINTILTLNTKDFNSTNNLKTTDFPSYLSTETGQFWFVLTCVEQRLGQITLTLRRDFLSEYWDSIKESPFICSKSATIPDTVSYAKYNKDTNLSQVKNQEVILRDRENGEGWLYIYISKKTQTYSSDYTDKDNPENNTTKNDVYYINKYNYDIEMDSLPSWANDSEVHCFIGNIKLVIAADGGGPNPQTQVITFDGERIIRYVDRVFVSQRGAKVFKINKGVSYTELESGFKSVYQDIIDKSNYINSLNGKIVKIGSVRYKFNLIPVNHYLGYGGYSSSISRYYSFKLTTTQMRTIAAGVATAPTEENITSIFGGTYYMYKPVFTELKDDKNEDIIREIASNSGRVHTSDSAFDVIGVPLGGTVYYKDGNTIKEIDVSGANKDLLIDAVKDLQETLTSSNVYDIQWLPYGPQFSKDNPIPPNDEVISYSLVKQGNTPIGLFYYLGSAQGSFSLSYELGIEVPSNNLEARIYNEETYMRLTGPNYASQFEFNIVRNGPVYSFDVDYALKPYSPYMKITPHFAGLYGKDFNDGRGLILSGDYSLDQVSNAWNDYQIRNKNYENIFNRQIQSLDLKNQYSNILEDQQTVSDWVHVFSGALSAGASGALGGSLIAGGPGAIIGGVVGGVSALGTGIYDAVTNSNNRVLTRAIRDDSKQAMIDQYQFQLGNIKAIPNTLTKVSTVNPNYKVYPILEIYKCTEQEDNNLRQSIKYNGININMICQLQDFEKGFVSGSLLQFPKININQAEADSINGELQYGIYIKEI